MNALVLTHAMPIEVRARLSAAELEVARMIADSCSNVDIARARGTAVSTTANQIGRIYRKLGVRCRRESGCVGMQWQVDTHRIMQLEVLESLGRWDELAALLARYATDANERGDLYLDVSLRVRFGATTCLARGDISGARAELDGAVRAWSRSEFDVIAMYAAIRSSWCDLYEGDARAAHRTMEDAWAQLRRSLLVRIVFYRDMVLAARASACLALARSDRGARAALHDALQISRGLARAGAPVPRAHAELIAAGAASIEGDASRYTSAARSFDALGGELVAHACRWRSGGPAAHPRLVEPKRVLSMLAP